MRDRVVTVTNEAAYDEAEEIRDGAHWAQLTGTDAHTGETVKFRLSRAAFFTFFNGAQRRSHSDVIVRPDRIISVEAKLCVPSG